MLDRQRAESCAESFVESLKKNWREGSWLRLRESLRSRERLYNDHLLGGGACLAWTGLSASYPRGRSPTLTLSLWRPDARLTFPGLHCCIWERSTNLFREQLSSYAKSSSYLFCSAGLCNGGWSANSGYFRIGFRLPSLTKEKQNPQSLKDKKQTVSLSVNLILLNPVWDYFHYCITVAIVLWIYLPRS